MQVSMKDIGKMIRPMDMGDLFTLMEIAIMVIGLMIKLMEGVYTSILTGQNISEIGKRTSNMDMELRHGQMLQNMKVIMNMEKNMELELLNGQMALLTLENFITIIFMEKECTHGQIIENMKVNGKQIKCTVKEHLHGLMGENILVNTQKTKRKDMENSSGLTEGVIEVSG